MEKISDVGKESNIAVYFSNRNQILAQKVGALLTEMYGETWNEYRLAYGAQIHMEKPRGLCWMNTRIGLEYDPTIGDVFTNIVLQENENYYLLLTRLDPRHKDNELYSSAVQRALYRFHELYSGRPRETGGGWRPPAPDGGADILPDFGSTKTP